MKTGHGYNGECLSCGVGLGDVMDFSLAHCRQSVIKHAEENPGHYAVLTEWTNYVVTKEKK